jgi:hypothetical protein
MVVRNHPFISVLSLMASVCLVLWLTGTTVARSDTGVHSRVDHSGLSVDFSAQCADGVVQLYGTITNATADPVTIRSGSFPWQYDVLGSEFIAEASGSKLKRDWTAPILGRVGPITLESHEQRSGLVPISTLFPDLHSALEKGAVTIRWKYWTGAKTARSGPSVFEDSLVISRDPCGGSH